MITMSQFADAGFHSGELLVQRLAGVDYEASRLKGMLQPAGLSPGARRFLDACTFLAITGRDRESRLWTSGLVGSRGFLHASQDELLVDAVPLPGDPLHQLAPGQKVGMIGIDFASRRRLRVNGILTHAGPEELLVRVEQAYGNCPRYIQQRIFADDGAPLTIATQSRTARELFRDDVRLVRTSDTFFLGTIDPERGADASHRGGAPGFVRVDHRGLSWPDYPGNNLFNSLGNLALNPEAALLFVDFRYGHALHLTGAAKVEWGKANRAGDDGGTGRIVRFRLELAVGGQQFAMHQVAIEPSPHNPELAN